MKLSAVVSLLPLLGFENDNFFDPFEIYVENTFIFLFFETKIKMTTTFLCEFAYRHDMKRLSWLTDEKSIIAWTIYYQ